MIFTKNSQGQSDNQNILTHRDLWRLLTDHKFPRNKIDCKYGKTLLYTHKRKIPGMTAQICLTTVEYCGLYNTHT